MNCYIVAESENDVLLLQTLLGPELKHYNGSVRVLNRHPRSSVLSTAQMLRVARHQPVALVLDANTVNPGLINDQKDWVVAYMGEPHRGLLWDVFLAVPALGVLLAPSQQFLEALLGGPVTVEQAVRARYEPGAVLDELTAERGISRADLLKRLAAMDLTPLRERSPIPELKAFLERASRLKA